MDFWKASKICEYVFLFLCYMTLFTNFIFHFYFHIAFLIHIICIFLSRRIATYSHHAYCRLLPSISIMSIAACCRLFPSPISITLYCHIAANFNHAGLLYCCPFHHTRIAILLPISSCQIAVLPPISSHQNCCITTHFITPAFSYL